MENKKLILTNKLGLHLRAASKLSNLATTFQCDISISNGDGNKINAKSVLGITLLAAGFGTRMGELGKVLPKALWPIFDKSLLELQIDFAQSLGIEKIFVNSHFLSEKIEKLINIKKLPVTLLYEKELLGSGGAIHNLAQQGDINYNGSVLILNSDQFYFLGEKSWKSFFRDESFDVRLLSIDVPAGSNYNGLELKDSLLKKINPPQHYRESYQTFSGISLVNLESLKPISGNTGYFDTVADYKNLKVEVISPEEQEYWDFGTLELYKSNILKLFKNLNDKMDSSALRFFKSYKAFDHSHLSQNSYGFVGDEFSIQDKKIYLKQKCL